MFQVSIQYVLPVQYVQRIMKDSSVVWALTTQARGPRFNSRWLEIKHSCWIYFCSLDCYFTPVVNEEFHVLSKPRKVRWLNTSSLESTHIHPSSMHFQTCYTYRWTNFQWQLSTKMTISCTTMQKNVKGYALLTILFSCQIMCTNLKIRQSVLTITIVGRSCQNKLIWDYIL